MKIVIFYANQKAITGNRFFYLNGELYAEKNGYKDTKNNILRANSSAAKMIGKAINEIEGKSAWDLYPQEAEQYYRDDMEVVNSGRPKLCIIELLTDASGNKKLMRTDKVPYRDENGNIRGVIVFSVDITARKKAEDALIEALKMKSDFISMVSHELRTPLAIIKEGISIILDKALGDINEEQSKYLGMAKDSVDRLGRLINSVLDYQKLESGKMEFKMEERDINAVIRDVAGKMMLLFEKKGLVFDLRLCDDLSCAGFDRDKIIQVLINLLNNALKFTEKGGVIISTSKKDDFIQVMVRDTGIGIKEGCLRKLFQEFTQLERGKDGTGLGLSICKKIIEAHKGKIWAESSLGDEAGTFFYFTLPIQ